MSETIRAADAPRPGRSRGLVGAVEVTGWQRTERWVARSSTVAAIAALLGWLGAITTGSGGWAVVMLLITAAVTVFAVGWVMRPGSLRWWSGLLVLLVVTGPATYAFVTLAGSISHVAGIFTLLAGALAGTTFVRRYEMPPFGK